jgi:hypothetical protein
MSRAEKTRPIPVDPEAEAQELERRAELNGNDAYQRGMAHAQAQERANAQNALNQGLADLQRVSLNRDTTQAGRDSYNRCWNRVEKAAQRVASITDGAIVDGNVTEAAVTIPAWLPPPTPTKEQTVTVRAPRTDGAYRETKGMGPSGKGLPLRGPGSNTDPDWMNTK